MPSRKHENIVELFRNRPSLAQEILRQISGLDVEGSSAEISSSDLSQVVSAEYRADALIIVGNSDQSARTAIIVEVQLNTDRRKKYTWPVYAAAAFARFACPVVLLVVAPKRRVTRWAAKPIVIGHPNFVLTPYVLGFDQVQRVTDLAVAGALPELAVLAAMALRDFPAAVIAEQAISGLSEDDQKLYLDIVLANLPPGVRRALEARMLKGYVYQSDFAKKYVLQGRAEALVTTLQKFLASKGIALSTDTQELIAKSSVDQLDRYLDRLYAGEDPAVVLAT